MAADQGGSPSDQDWAEAKVNAAGHMAADAAAGEVLARKPNTWLVALLAVALSLFMALDLYLMRRAPDPLPVAEQEVDLRFIVADVVEEIEVFRQAQGRLPTAADLDGLLDEEISYEANGNAYRVVAAVGRVRLEYDGSVPLEAWVTQRSGVRAARGGS